MCMPGSIIVGREDHGVALVGGHGGDDVGAAHGFRGRCGSARRAGRRVRVALRRFASSFARRARVDVEQAQLADAEQVMKRDRLEFALRAVADQRHRRGYPGRASQRAASADIAAVRSAVVTVSSESSSG